MSFDKGPTKLFFFFVTKIFGSKLQFNVLPSFIKRFIKVLNAQNYFRTCQEISETFSNILDEF
ncbi:hypothetical protein HOLleu_18142 [Holothuria leucospilota]|uniref:Uncharacterized protein n=1 Tax=Holothuria leucospilota TaxID=206669 RepID=A0A9Q1C2P7_HOLLE|nr:hypothetical protein HOLleu_18142 [Holothuria leucospilota]